MADYPALPLWTDAWLADTLHLTREQSGTYLALLVLMWRTQGCRVPDDDGWLANRLRMTPGEVMAVLRPLVTQFCQSDGNWLTQKRLTREREYVAAATKRAKDRAKARWDKEKGRCYSNAQRSNAPTPTPITTTELRSVVVRAAASPPRRGTRWDAGRTVPLDWLAAAQAARREHGLAEIDLGLEATKFENFWSSKSGASATKVDWGRTWINWVLNAQGGRHGNGKTKGPTAHDKFFSAAASIIRDQLGCQAGAAQGVDDHPDAVEVGGPLLPARLHGSAG